VDSTPPDARVGEPVRQEFDAARTRSRWRCQVEEPELLADRLRQAVWVILAATALFAVADLGIAPGVFVLAYALKAALVAFLVGMLAWLRRRGRTAREILWAAILTINATYLLMVSGDVLKGHYATAPMLAVVLGMAAAAVFPWGVVAQVGTALPMLAGTVVVLLLSGRPLDDLIDPAASVVGALGVSVYVAHAFARYRGERRAAEVVLTTRAQLEAARADARLAAASRPTFVGVAQGAADALVRHLGLSAATMWWRTADGGRFELVAHAGSGRALADVLDAEDTGADLEARLTARSERSGVLPPAHVHRVVVAGVPVGVLCVSAPGPVTAAVPDALTSIGEVVQDSRDRMRNDEARARLLEELERTNRMKSQFVSTMSHELRTPLNVILGYADLLEELDNDERRTAVNRISRAGRELLELIEATLDMNRLEAGRDEVELAPVALGELWRELRGELDPVPRAPELELTWGPAPWATLRTDRRKLKIVLKNLVGNAIKFTREGEVHVTCGLEDGACVFHVRDTGIGIARRDLPHIFDMFRQVDSSDRRPYGGVGLGLHIVQRFCQQLGGTVTVESEPGIGSVFTVRLPQGPAAARAA
jgi:signal transduction histidine kinase